MNKNATNKYQKIKRNKMSGVPPEYTLYLDTYNRNKSCVSTEPNNPTNDVVIPTKMPRSRMPTMQMHLGSIELPLAQYTIESNWNNFNFDEGLDLIVNGVSDLPLRQFSVTINGTTTTVNIPIYLNPITSVTLSGGNTVGTFTTAFPHALDIRGAWTWKPIELISTEIVDPTVVELTESNTNLTILDDTTFELTGLDPAASWVSGTGVYGYIHAPSIPSPTALASVIETALTDALGASLFSITYNTTTGMFSIKYMLTKTTPEVCYTNPATVRNAQTLSNDLVYIQINGQNSLPALMGFGKGVGPIPIPTPDSSQCLTDPNCTAYELTGSLGFQCLSTVEFWPGNYDATGFGTQLVLQTNRFYFTASTVLVFSNQIGTTLSITIDPGMYTPDTFAEYLEDQMNSLDTLSSGYTVDYNPETGNFCFENSDALFGLEFANTGTTFNSNVIGYNQINYTGSMEYCSVNPFQVPTKGCCGTNIPERYLSNIYNPVVNSSDNRYTLQAGTLPCITGATISLSGTFYEIDFTSANIAHGFQPEDIVIVRDNGTPAVVAKLRVVEVVDAFIFRVDPGVVTLGNAGSVCAERDPIWNIYFSESRPNQMYGRFFGFDNIDLLWDSSFNQQFSLGNTLFKSSFNIDLSTPNYLLVVIDEPKGATHNNHAWGENNIPNVFAKIILYPEFRVERIYPMNMYMPEVQTIVHLKIRILNPDHTLYQFHGRNWSATLVFTIQENTNLQLSCF